MNLELTVSGLTTPIAAANQFCAKHFSDYYPCYHVHGDNYEVCNSVQTIQFSVKAVGG